MKNVFPYPILAGDVALLVEKVWVDNIPLSLSLVSDDESVIALHSLKRDWNEIRVNVVVTADAEEISSDEWVNPSCVAVLRNRKTNVRLTFPLHEEEAGVWRGEIELRQGEHLGRCEIDAWVVAEVRGVGSRLIGRAVRRWSADFEARQPTRQRSIKMIWKDFADHPFLKEFRDDPWMLDAEVGEPVLYLNSSIEGFRAVLDAPSNSSAERKLVREVMATQIASEAWTAMFNTALYASSVDASGTPQWPGGWQEEVLRKMLPDLFPEIAPDEALAELVARREGGESGSDLHARLMHSATLNSKKQKTVADTVRTLTRMANGRGQG
ncbi:hypothetical protein [Streptomyces sp. NBC_01716]|uniref:hypothetical protein n=1 Tax=Streptomyces sp. NBC_01716 TaxID=2975917 RepID=UPI002E308A52|nr:hypothetical protein [Streptomyces sp. NBC_01716]